MSKLTKEQERALADLAVKTAEQEGVQKVRRWTDVGDYDQEEADSLYHDHQCGLGPPF